MRFEGTLTTWNDERGFGFLRSSQGGDDIFVHATAFGAGGGRPQPGRAFSFEIERGPQGRKRAKNVRPAGAAATQRPRRGTSKNNSPAQRGTATLFTLPAFLLLYVAVAILWKPPAIFAAFYAIASLATFIAYWGDKAAAARGGWRTAENTLHLLSLAGGWPGALLAQQYLRHKSAKASFRAAFWLTVVLNVAAFVFLASPAGRAYLPHLG